MLSHGQAIKVTLQTILHWVAGTISVKRTVAALSLMALRCRDSIKEWCWEMCIQKPAPLLKLNQFVNKWTIWFSFMGIGVQVSRFPEGAALKPKVGTSLQTCTDLWLPKAILLVTKIDSNRQAGHKASNQANNGTRREKGKRRTNCSNRRLAQCVRYLQPQSTGGFLALRTGQTCHVKLQRYSAKRWVKLPTSTVHLLFSPKILSRNG